MAPAPSTPSRGAPAAPVMPATPASPAAVIASGDPRTARIARIARIARVARLPGAARAVAGQPPLHAARHRLGDAAPRALDEVDEEVHLPVAAELLADAGHRLPGVQPGARQQPEGLAEAGQLRAVEALAP